MGGSRLKSLQAGIWCAITVAAMACVQTRGAENISSNAIDLTKFLVKGYDKAIRPQCERPTDVKLDFYVESFGNIEEANLEFSVFMYFRQMWRDPRLADRVNQSVVLQRDQISYLWFPDTYCSNAKRSDLMSPDTEIHSSLTLEPDGSIFYSRSAHIVASCEMDLRDFPMDTQTCNLVFGSYGYTDNDIKLSWKSTKILIANKEMAQFSLGDCVLSSKTMEYVQGNYTLLSASFPMHRRIGYYAIQMYVPCTFLVMLSWIVFWMNPEETGNRLTVGITTILTIVFLLGYTNSTLPKVSYVKGMDWYLMVSFLFIFLSLCECIVVDRACKHAKLNTRKKSKKSNGKKQQQLNQQPKQQQQQLQREKMEQLNELQSARIENLTLFEPNCNDFLPEGRIVQTKTWVEGPVEQHSKDREGTRNKCCPPCAHSTTNRVDQCSRLAFPFLFILYNVLYWYSYKYGVAIF